MKSSSLNQNCTKTIIFFQCARKSYLKNCMNCSKIEFYLSKIFVQLIVKLTLKMSIRNKKSKIKEISKAWFANIAKG